MKRRSFLSLIPLGALFAGCGFKPFHFIQMADTQLGMIERSEDGNSFAAETRMVERVVAQINVMEPPPAFVVVCGDLTNLPAHEGQIAEYKRLMGLLKPSIPYRNVSGNHDFTGNPNPGNLAFYRATFGPDRYYFDLRGRRFVVLNSTLMKFADECRDEADSQVAWLEETLAGAAEMDGTIVFMHHPFFDVDIDEDDGYHSITRADRRFYLDLFAENNVEAVFSGHRHTTIPEHDYRGVALVNTNAVCNSFDGNAGLRVVKVTKEGLRHVFYPWDGLPGRVDLGRET